jgi:hypothetical protein
MRWFRFLLADNDLLSQSLDVQQQLALHDELHWFNSIHALLLLPSALHKLGCLYFFSQHPSPIGCSLHFTALQWTMHSLHEKTLRWV